MQGNTHQTIKKENLTIKFPTTLYVINNSTDFYERFMKFTELIVHEMMCSRMISSVNCEQFVIHGSEFS